MKKKNSKISSSAISALAAAGMLLTIDGMPVVKAEENESPAPAVVEEIPTQQETDPASTNTEPPETETPSDSSQTPAGPETPAEPEIPGSQTPAEPEVPASPENPDPSAETLTDQSVSEAN